MIFNNYAQGTTFKSAFHQPTAGGASAYSAHTFLPPVEESGEDQYSYSGAGAAQEPPAAKSLVSRLKGWLVKGLVIVAGANMVRKLFQGHSLLEQGKNLFTQGKSWIDTLSSGLSKVFSFFGQKAAPAAPTA